MSWLLLLQVVSSCWLVSCEPGAYKLLYERLRALKIFPNTLEKSSSGLTLAQDVQDGQLIFSIPRQYVLSKDSAQDTELVQFLDPEEGPVPYGMPHWSSLPPEFVMTLQLLHRLRPGAAALTEQDRLWDAWLGAAPAETNSTIYWTEEELAKLQGSPLLAQSRARVEELASLYKSLLQPLIHHNATFFPPNHYSLDNFTRIASLVHALAVVPSSNRNSLLLPLPPVPVEDVDTSLLVDSSTDTVVLRAGQRMQAGAALAVGAGPFLNLDLMIRNGRALDHPKYGAWPLQLGLTPGDTLFDVKHLLLTRFSQQAEGQEFVLRLNDIPPMLPVYLRMIVMDEEDLQKLEQGKLPEKPLSPANEDHAFRHFAQQCELRLAAYKETLEEDEYLMEEHKRGMEPRDQAALVLRKVEKQILSMSVATMNNWLLDYLNKQERERMKQQRPALAAPPHVGASAATTVTDTAAGNGTPNRVQRSQGQRSLNGDLDLDQGQDQPSPAATYPQVKQPADGAAGSKTKKKVDGQGKSAHSSGKQKAKGSGGHKEKLTVAREFNVTFQEPVMGLEILGVKNATSHQILVKGIVPNTEASRNPDLTNGLQITYVNGKSIEGKTARYMHKHAQKSKRPITLTLREFKL